MFIITNRGLVLIESDDADAAGAANKDTQVCRSRDKGIKVCSRSFISYIYLYRIYIFISHIFISHILISHIFISYIFIHSFFQEA